MVDLTLVEPVKKSSRDRFFARYQNVVDRHGFNLASYAGVERFIRFLYQKWFEVQIAGIENIPAKGNAVLFGNHSGGLPLDGCLLYDGIINEHPNPSRVRFLVTKFLLNTPLVGKFLRGFGCVPPDFEIAVEMLRMKEIVLIFPEGEKGTGKLFKDRYKLVDFHSGFVRASIATGSPLIPVVTIGGEETYPIFAHVKPLAKLLRMPYFPLTPFFPWLPPPLCAIPFPSKIMICVWPAFALNYPPEAAENEELVQAIANDVRKDLQAKVKDLLDIRTSPFKKWDMHRVNSYLRNTRFYSPDMEKHLHKV